MSSETRWLVVLWDYDGASDSSGYYVCGVRGFKNLSDAVHKFKSETEMHPHFDEKGNADPFFIPRNATGVAVMEQKGDEEAIIVEPYAAGQTDRYPTKFARLQG